MCRLWLRSEGFSLQTVTASSVASRVASNATGGSAAGNGDGIDLQYWVKETADIRGNTRAERAPLQPKLQLQLQPHAQSQAHVPPVAVFAHGMGIGLLTYCFTVLPELQRPVNCALRTVNCALLTCRSTKVCLSTQSSRGSRW